MMTHRKFIISRVWRGEQVIVPQADTVLHTNDNVLVVTDVYKRQMFWWGESPKEEIRHHLQFYPACNGKCKPILHWICLLYTSLRISMSLL